MSAQSLRWGILGAANVARKNWLALRLAGNTTLVAVASRTPGRARAFIGECQAEHPFPTPPAPFESYEDLLRAPDIDAIYIPLPTGLRREWVVRAAEAGKHVLCEKPCAPSLDDLRAMTDACRAHGVQFMDGVMFVHSRRMHRIVETLREGSTVGEIRRVATQFSFAAPADFTSTNIRAHAGLEPQGCAGDLGWYCIRFTLSVLPARLPVFVTARRLSTFHAPGAAEPVPSELSAELVFPDNVSASFYCSFRALNQQWAHVSGTRGHLAVTDFVLPYVGDTLVFDVAQPDFVGRGCDFRMVPHTTRIAIPEHSHGAEVSPEVNLFRNFSAAALSGRLNPDWPDIALRTQSVLDAVMESAAHEGRSVRPRPV